LNHPAALNQAPLDDPPASDALELVKLYAAEQSYVLTTEDDQEENLLPEKRPMRVSWDWRIVGAREFQVMFGLSLLAAKDLPEQIRVSYVATFRLLDQPFGMELRRFAKLNAIALMLPHLREAIMSLTSRGFFGPVLIPLMDPAKIAEDIREIETTAGNQYRENPKLAEIFGPMEELYRTE
jgi:preprotein translocase subunit SecB